MLGRSSSCSIYEIECGEERSRKKSRSSRERLTADDPETDLSSDQVSSNLEDCPP